ncbi:adhesion G-protein coupled receptor G7 isoform X1 [Gallus gallus]|uniref:adhesion G-protein coupled receptor G7 isoform X1 n=1 Tax=Gallus gallus TaxID=9031 RepID=UPI001AEA4884|nr:adhesion G-protein coupled receptor G7 isoform X1 [Gallus gallus]
MPSLHWERVLLGIACCAVTVTLCSLCIWQLVVRFHKETTGPVAPPCFCLNGGFCQDRTCVCPSEWAGPFCDIVNFCEDSVYTVNISENVIKNLTFERVVVGKYSSSKEKCEPNTVNGNSSIAVRLCSRRGIIPVLEPPSILNCNENLDSLALRVEIADTSSVSAIASNTQILTSIPSQLTTQNISAAANIAVQILRKPNVSEDSQASVAVLTTVSQLLDANETEFNNNNLVNVTASLTKTMEEFSLMGNVTQPNVAVQSAPLKPNSSTVLFLVQRDTTLGYFPSTKLEIQENVPGLTSELSTEVQILLDVKSNSSSNDGRVGFVLYQNDKLFQSRIYRSNNNLSKQIVSGNIDGGRANGVEIAFNPKYNTSELQLRDHACVFWDYAINDWSTAGCTKGRDQFLRCKCNHTTNFAVLMAFQIKYKYAKPLEYISYVGVGLSIAGLTITILFQIFTRKTRKSSITWMLVSLCFSMLIFNIIFISGIENHNARKDSSDTSGNNQQFSTYTTTNTILTSDVVDPPADAWCMVVAVLLHYFLLATFMWTALNSAQLYLLLLRTMKPFPGHFIVTMSAIGWGVPAAVVAITLGATYGEGKALNYRQEEFCWLAALDQNQNFSMKKPMFWSFLLPVAFILLFNIIIFIEIIVSVIWKENKNLTRNKKDSLVKKMTATISIVVVLGITWTIGYLMLISHEETNLFFSYAFCIFNATQGLQICILYTFRSPIFKKKVSEVSSVLRVPGIQFYLHSEIYHVSKSQPAKHTQGIFRLSEIPTENISLSTLPNGC